MSEKTVSRLLPRSSWRLATTIAREIEVEDVGPLTARERPDVALGASSEHALGLIDQIVREAACPVIVLLHAPNPEFVKEASKRGVFAHISDDDVEHW